MARSKFQSFICLFIEPRSNWPFVTWEVLRGRMARNGDGWTRVGNIKVLKVQGGRFTSPQGASEPLGSYTPPKWQHSHTRGWPPVHQRHRAGSNSRPRRKRYGERSDWFCLVILPRFPRTGDRPLPLCSTRRSIARGASARCRREDLPSNGGFTSDLVRVTPEKRETPLLRDRCWMCDRPLRK